MIPNPAFKGKHVRTKIINPYFQGYWEQPLIENPLWVKVHNPARRLPINYIAFDLLQVGAGTLFGTIVLADNMGDIEPYLWDQEMFDAEIEAHKKFKKRVKEEDQDVVKENEETETQGVEDVVELHNDL